MKKLVLLFVYAGYAFCISAQPDMELGKTLGGNHHDLVNQILQTSDGGYLVVGRTESADDDVSYNHGNEDVWVVKLDASWQIVWEKTYGGTADDSAEDVVELNDGSFVIVAYSNSNDGDVSGRHGINYDAWIFKISQSGELLWQRMYGGSQNEWPQTIIKTPEGNVLVVGFTYSSNGDIPGNNGLWDGFAVTFSSSGNIVWSKVYGGASGDYLRSVVPTDDGGWMLFGEILSSLPGSQGGLDYWLIKTDAQGNLLWQKSYGGSQFEEATVIHKTNDGAFILFGRSASHDGDVISHIPGHADSDLWIVRVNATGDIVWEKAIGGTSYELVNTVIQDVNGAFILGGENRSNDFATNPFYGLTDSWVMKMSPAGDVLWTKTFGGYDFDYCNALLATPDGGFIAANTTFSSTREVIGNHGDFDIWLVKFGATVGVFSPAQTPPAAINITPNPAVNTINFQLPENLEATQVTIADASGKVVLQATHTNRLDISALNPAWYSVTVSSKTGKTFIGKFFKTN
jgi:hypothetical protein